MSKVLVTGGSGFIGIHCVKKLLEAGHEVRVTLRDLRREPEVKAMLAPGAKVSCVAAELSSDAGWKEAVAGCEYVVHVASPTLTVQPKNDEEFVRPAREGVLRVLTAAREAGVKRVVLTSAFGAIAYGHPPREKPYTEEDWTNVDGGIAPYQKSKTLSERAAWAFIEREGRGLELAVVNPVGVLGPLLGADLGPSLQLPLRMLKGEMPGCPKFSFPFVDVRDVAELHVLAMTRPEAKGQRFIASSGASLSVLGLSKLMHERLGALAAKAPLREIPSWLLRITALFNPQVKMIVPQLGMHISATSEKAERLLGWKARPNGDSIVDTAESFVKFGLLKPLLCGSSCQSRFD
ncbi:MAG: aldehyde reductase [Myxococcaceae bacterium]